MKICFPVEEDRGLDSPVYEHFGAAPRYLLVDEETGELTSVRNRCEEHGTGKCNPAESILGKDVASVVVGGIGPGALSKLISLRMTVYQAASGTVGTNIAKLKDGSLQPFSSISTCAGKAGAGGCGAH